MRAYEAAQSSGLFQEALTSAQSDHSPARIGQILESSQRRKHMFEFGIIRLLPSKMTYELFLDEKISLIFFSYTNKHTNNS
jgi:hypothetical protein